MMLMKKYFSPETKRKKHLSSDIDQIINETNSIDFEEDYDLKSEIDRMMKSRSDEDNENIKKDIESKKEKIEQLRQEQMRQEQIRQEQIRQEKLKQDQLKQVRITIENESKDDFTDDKSQDLINSENINKILKSVRNSESYNMNDKVSVNIGDGEKELKESKEKIRAKFPLERQKSVANDIKDSINDYTINEEDENNEIIENYTSHIIKLWNVESEQHIQDFCWILSKDENSLRMIMNRHFYCGKGIQITLIIIGCVSMILREQSNWNLISGAIVSTLTGLTNFIAFDKNFLHYQAKYENIRKLKTYIQLQMIKPVSKRKEPSEILEKVATARLKILEGT